MSQGEFYYYRRNIGNSLKSAVTDPRGAGNFLKNLSLLLVINIFCFFTASLLASTSVDSSPNIIIILADDLGVGDLSHNGSLIRTPNIDRLIREGVYLSDFYASANVCTPSRAGLLTGRYPIRMGLADNVIEADSEHGLPQSEITIAELLKSKSYQTSLIGKWHLGHSKEHWPTEHGFDYYYGLLYSNDMSPLSLYENSRKIQENVIQQELTGNYTEKAINRINESEGEPFFIFLSHSFPHIPLHASEKFRGKSQAGIYGDAVEELDWSVGQLIRALKEKNIDRDTLVFFTSDNGAWFEGSNAGHRGMKGMTWDGGFRVPLVAWWPGKISPGTVSAGISMNIDLLPTIAEVANITDQETKSLDGKNIWSLLMGNSESPHEALYFFNNEDIAALRTQDWKYTARAYYKTRYIGFEGIEEKMGFRYELLFDMRQEMEEIYSQAENQPEVLGVMKDKLARARAIFDPLQKKPKAKVFP